tara:strand:+ start:198 stop:497 length:300 start_codon:yes stop_codon:yes gene_type:complete
MEVDRGGSLSMDENSRLEDIPAWRAEIVVWIKMMINNNLSPMQPLSSAAGVRVDHIFTIFVKHITDIMVVELIITEITVAMAAFNCVDQVCVAAIIALP